MTWSCCRPTRCTASPPTRSSRGPCPPCSTRRVAAGTCRRRSWSAPGSTLDGLVFSLPAAARALTEAFWPGALTIVVEQAPTLQWDLGDTYGTVAVRMPLHPVALEVLQHTGPLAVSSANRTGVAAGGHRGRGPGAARVRRGDLPRGRAVLRPDPVDHRRLHRAGAADPARRRDPARAAARGRAEHRAVRRWPSRSCPACRNSPRARSSDAVHDPARLRGQHLPLADGRAPAHAGPAQPARADRSRTSTAATAPAPDRGTSASR